MMVTIERSTTLGAAMDAYPQLAREFERRGMDYYCGGGRTLAEACASIGADPQTVVAELAAVVATSEDEPAKWASMPADALVEHLEATHHRYLWDELPRVAAMVDKIVSVHGDRHPELAEIAHCYSKVQADLEQHMVKEERVLFPIIRELATSAEWVTWANLFAVTRLRSIAVRCATRSR